MPIGTSTFRALSVRASKASEYLKSVPDDDDEEEDEEEEQEDSYIHVTDHSHCNYRH